MSTVTAVKARDNFSEVVARAAYGKERIYITKNGKNLAALIPVEDMKLLEELEDRLDAAEADRILDKTKSTDLVPLEDYLRKRGSR
ncbi:MAG: type II toxin-antitoxin system Phd/YefM family antitoxin [Deltaproteobacteria bacterium]|nr:type II toxin-antitoxin system Phd/YefM family antitoxin [Deltaproteobacteria bacterium]